MIHSLFLMNGSGNVIIEKHWNGVIPRSVADLFFDYVKRAGTADETLPVIRAPNHCFVHILRDDLIYLCVLKREVPPLLVLEFLHRVADIFVDYFGEVSEVVIKENFVIVYQLLEEMVDNGFPFSTEPNALKDMIAPPTIFTKVVTAVTGVSGANSQLPTASISNIPWRKPNVRYTNNEVFFDIIEEIDAIVDGNGATVSSEVHGEITCQCRLSGMPDLLITFNNPRVIDDASFHPCVRYARYERERVLSFVPPDGFFKLMSYRVNASTQQSLPIFIKPQFFFSGSGGKFEISMGHRNSGGKPIENSSIYFYLPVSVQNVQMAGTFGAWSYDQVTKLVRWDLGRIPVKIEKAPSLSGTIILQQGETLPSQSSISINVEFVINSLTSSGLKIDNLLVHNENYKPFKGLRSFLKNGKYQVRTSV